MFWLCSVLSTPSKSRKIIFFNKLFYLGHGRNLCVCISCINYLSIHHRTGSLLAINNCRVISHSVCLKVTFVFTFHIYSCNFQVYTAKPARERTSWYESVKATLCSDRYWRYIASLEKDSLNRFASMLPKSYP